MDGGRGYGNRNTIAIEICRNYDRERRTTRLREPQQSQYTKAEENAIKVGAVIMYEQGINPTLSNIKFHNEWSGKNCPSKILNERRGSQFKARAVAEAVRYKAKMDGGHVPPASKPSKPKPSGNKSLDKLVDETLAGLHGSGNDRKKSLGSNYSAVQNRINAMYNKGGTPSKSTRTLANEVIAGKHGSGSKRKKSLGGRYNEVQKMVNRIVSGKASGSSSKPKRKSTQQLVNEVMAGKHGSGAERKKSLGSRYNEVQNAINKGSGSSSSSSRKSTQQLVSEVMAGKHGSGAERKKSLGSRYNEVQNAINKGSKGGSGKSHNISKLANKIINSSNAPKGIVERQRWLGVDKKTYQKVQNEINRRFR